MQPEKGGESVGLHTGLPLLGLGWPLHEVRKGTWVPGYQPWETAVDKMGDSLFECVGVSVCGHCDHLPQTGLKAHSVLEVRNLMASWS